MLSVAVAHTHLNKVNQRLIADSDNSNDTTDHSLEEIGRRDRYSRYDYGILGNSVSR